LPSLSRNTDAASTAHQLRRFRFAQRRERKSQEPRVAFERLQHARDGEVVARLARPHRGREQDSRGRIRHARDIVQKRRRGRVEPLQIVEDERKRTLPCHVAKQRSHRIEEPRAIGGRRRGRGECRMQQRQVVPQRLRHLGSSDRAQGIGPRPIGMRRFGLEGAAAKCAAADHRHALGQIIEQTALADAWFAADQENRGGTAIGDGRHQMVDRGPFASAADDGNRRSGPSRRGGSPGRHNRRGV
jgi:hypothetical protein